MPIRRHRPKNQDSNHKLIRETLRLLCPAVEDTSDVGRGFPDLLVRVRSGRVYLVEVKNPERSEAQKRLTPDEVNMKMRWGDAYVVVETVEQAHELART